MMMVDDDWVKNPFCLCACEVPGTVYSFVPKAYNKWVNPTFINLLAPPGCHRRHASVLRNVCLFLCLFVLFCFLFFCFVLFSFVFLCFLLFSFVFFCFLLFSFVFFVCLCVSFWFLKGSKFWFHDFNSWFPVWNWKPTLWLLHNSP